MECHTTNIQRTIFSAFSLLMGMFPDTPRFFNYATEQRAVDYDKVC